MKLIKHYNQWFFFLVFLLIGGIFILFLNNNFEQKELDAREERLTHAHSRVVDQFTNSVDKFAGLVSGMRSFMNLSPQLPSEIEFQQFVKRQLDDIDTDASIVVSYIDSTHTFRQSFTRTEINPAGLVGKKVSTIRSQKKIDALNNLMKHDSLRMFPPLNLIEGWVGVPINFRVHRDGRTLGYVAPILGFKSVIQDIYDSEGTDDFVFHFVTEDGYDFDREHIKNGTTVYNVNEDVENYVNFVKDSGLFQYTTNEYYGFDIKIGAAYKLPYNGNIGRSSILLFWYMTFALLAFVVTWQINKSKELNRELLTANARLDNRHAEIEQKNKELLDLNTTQTRFFSIIGHDLKQPLNSIEGLLFLLKNEKIDDPELDKIIHHLAESTSNTTDLLNNLLKWALSENGEMQFKPSELSIDDLVKGIVEASQYQASEKGIAISHRLDEGLTYEGDRDMLNTTLRNLVNNALKFTNSGGEVIIQTKVTEEYLNIDVVDNGIGMSPEDVASLFVIDAQVSTQGTNGEKGTGLGLVLCRSFVEQHGGTIAVESELGVGTKFSISLPIKNEVKDIQKENELTLAS